MNFKKYRNIETGEEVEGIAGQCALWGFKYQLALNNDEKTIHYFLTKRHFKINYEEIIANENNKL